MTVLVQEVTGDDIKPLIPLLLLAEESKSALQWSLNHMSDSVYRMDDDDRLVGAATMQWRNNPCELMELAIDEVQQGHGYGKLLVAWLLDEARRRGKQQMLVGTANSSINNIAFYQKCGFRMDHVRQDYFWYYRTPHYENNIQIRDMLVFRYDLDINNVQGSGRKSRMRR